MRARAKQPVRPWRISKPGRFEVVVHARTAGGAVRQARRYIAGALGRRRQPHLWAIRRDWWRDGRLRVNLEVHQDTPSSTEVRRD